MVLIGLARSLFECFSLEPDVDTLSDLFNCIERNVIQSVVKKFVLLSGQQVVRDHRP